MLTLKPQWQFMRITRLLFPCQKNPQFHGRAKHVDIECHFVRDHVHKVSINIFYCPTSHMLICLQRDSQRDNFVNCVNWLVLQTSHPKLFNYNEECWKRHCYWTVYLYTDVNLFWCDNVLWQIRHHHDLVLNSRPPFFAMWLTRNQFVVVSGNLDFY